MSVFFITNNPELARSFSSDAWPRADEASPQVLRPEETSGGALCVLFDTDALSVLTAARDAIHNGWRLTHHPLYGNYRPNQQPYRSLILEYPFPRSGSREPGCEPDLLSLRLIEEALLIYADCPPLAPKTAPAALLDACALLDCELMRLPMQQAGIWTTGMEEATQRKRPAMRLAS